MNRQERAAVAAETDAVVAAGGYQVDGAWIDLRPMVDAARAGTALHLPEADLAAARGADRDGRVEVRGESTLAAAARAVGGARDRVAILNFASAKHPGGGYRGGSQAQEESIARSSALVTCLETVPAFYDFHRWQNDVAYSDRVIWSPAVPVFRDDDGRLLAEPYAVDVLTAAAPNAGAMRSGRGALPALLERRATRVIDAAAHHGTGHLILGAWGCGVFRNDPAMVAGAFRSALAGGVREAFDTITFAVLDGTPGQLVRTAFEGAFGGDRR